MEAIDVRILDNLMKYAEHLEMLAEHHQVTFQLIENLQPKSSASFTVKAPYYLVLYSLQNEDYLVNAGYLMEQITLYLTTKGIGSCYIGMNKLEAEEEYHPTVVLAFGKTDHNIHRDSRKIKRIQLDELCSFKATVNDNIKQMLQAARLAPSALNRQPWRFVVYDNRIHVFCKKEIMVIKHYRSLQYIDIGIALSHLILAAEELWLNTELVKSENIAEKSFKKNEYMLTLKIMQ